MKKSIRIIPIFFFLIQLIIPIPTTFGHQNIYSNVMKKYNLNYSRIEIAKCRATCVNKFIKDEERILEKWEENMAMCWDFCEMIKIQPVWINVCRTRSICFKGCQVACNYYNNGQPFKEVKNSVDKRLQVEQEYLDKSHLCLKWKNVVDHPVVYITFAKLLYSKEWEEIEQTTTNEFCPKKSESNFSYYLIIGTSAQHIYHSDIIKTKNQNTLKIENHLKLLKRKKRMRDATFNPAVYKSSNQEISTIKLRRRQKFYEENNLSILRLRNETILALLLLIMLTLTLVILVMYFCYLFFNEKRTTSNNPNFKTVKINYV